EVERGACPDPDQAERRPAQHAGRPRHREAAPAPPPDAAPPDPHLLQQVSHVAPRHWPRDHPATAPLTNGRPAVCHPGDAAATLARCAGALAARKVGPSSASLAEITGSRRPRPEIGLGAKAGRAACPWKATCAAAGAAPGPG